MDQGELTADGVRQASFRSQVGGYAKRPVRELLARVAAAMEAGRPPSELTVTAADLPAKNWGYRLDDVQQLLTQLGVTIQPDPGALAREAVRIDADCCPLTSGTLVRDDRHHRVLDADDFLLGYVRREDGWESVEDRDGQVLLRVRPASLEQADWIVTDARGVELGRLVRQGRLVGPSRRRYDLRSGGTVLAHCQTRLMGNVVSVEAPDGTEIAYSKHRDQLMDERGDVEPSRDTVWTLHQPLAEPLRSLTVCVALHSQHLFPPPSPPGNESSTNAIGTGQ